MWLSPPSIVCSPSIHEVHLWRTNLDLQIEQIQELAQLLCADEKNRAARFYFEQHRNRFIVARGQQKVILGNYLGIAPTQIEFVYSSRGKPNLAPSCNGKRLQFNVSHSQDLALYGFACDRAIGVDLEYLRPMDDANQIAQRFFSARESATIKSLPEPEKSLAFFQVWTAKEAYLKATGDGIGSSLDRVEISFLPNEPLRLLAVDGDEEAAARWRLDSLTPAANYIATIAVEGHDWVLSCWH